MTSAVHSDVINCLNSLYSNVKYWIASNYHSALYIIVWCFLSYAAWFYTFPPGPGPVPRLVAQACLQQFFPLVYDSMSCCWLLAPLLHMWECHHVSLVTILSLRESHYYIVTLRVVALIRAARILLDMVEEVGPNGSQSRMMWGELGALLWPSCRAVKLCRLLVEVGEMTVRRICRCWLAPVVASTEAKLWLALASESESHCDWQSVSRSVLVSCPIWDIWPETCLFNLVEESYSLVYVGTLSDERSGLSFVS
jgi:hypothetical protein